MIQVSIYNHNLCIRHFDFDRTMHVSLVFTCDVRTDAFLGYTHVLVKWCRSSTCGKKSSTTADVDVSLLQTHPDAVKSSKHKSIKGSKHKSPGDCGC